MSSLFACCGKRETHRWRAEAGQEEFKKGSMPKMSPGAPAQGKQRLCGVGVVFKPVPDAAGRVQLQVYSVAPISPAERTGLIMPEDILIAVDGTAVGDLSAEQVAPMVVGQEGTDVTLRFRRGDEDFDVTMNRVWGSVKAKNTE